MDNVAAGAVQIRIARHTARLDAVVGFYRDGLGLPVLGRFEDHAGYDGVMLGLPDRRHHLEFTTHVEKRAVQPADPDNLLVFYLADAHACQGAAARLLAAGGSRVSAANPYWRDVGAITVEDPDGWRVVLVPTVGL